MAALALGLASIAYLVIAIRGALSHPRYAATRREKIDFALPITVLKPLCGIPVVTRLMQEFPNRDITLLVDETCRGTNPKVANLINMVGAAKNAFLVISDSDVRIDPECLSGVVAPLAEARVGETPLWLVPVRECLCFAIWAVSLVGRGARRRRRHLSITHDGRLVSPERTAPSLKAAPAPLA